MNKLVLASNNAKKVKELQSLLQPLGITVVTQGELGVPEAEEPHCTFVENALAKARHASRLTGLPALADDSGLAVEALNGAPGIHSARWAGPEHDFARAMRTVEERLQALGAAEPERRRAQFVCALALAIPDGPVETFVGRVYGTLVWPPRGEEGFGYDPMFLPDGHRRTFGEMSAEEKHGWTPGKDDGLSPRARAFALFARECLGIGG